MNKGFDEIDMIHPPTDEQIDDLGGHNVGLAIRLSAKLGRPFEDLEWKLFPNKAPLKVYKIVELENERFGVA